MNTITNTRDYEDEVARQIKKSPSPTWLKIVLVLACIYLVAVVGLAFWMTTHPEQWARVLDYTGVQHPQPLFITLALMTLAAAAAVAHRRLIETETTLGWWLRIYYRRLTSLPGRLAGRTKRIFWTVIFATATLAQQIKAASGIIIIIAIVVVGVTIYAVVKSEPSTYLTVEVADNGLPVRGTWGVSEATAATLAKDSRRRAEGPFKRGDATPTRRAEINNQWDAEGFDQTQYPFPMGPLAASPKARITMEKLTWGTPKPGPMPPPPPAPSLETVVDESENWRFVQLPNWTLTNTATLTSEPFTRARPQLGGLSIAVILDEAKAAGTLWVSDEPAAFFSIRSEPVIPAAK